MMVIGRAGSIGWKTVRSTYLIASVGTSLRSSPSSLSSELILFAEDGPATVMLACNAEGSFITEMSDGSLTCAMDAMAEIPRLSSMTSPVPSSDQVAVSLTLFRW
jgi:hypothetical protein